MKITETYKKNVKELDKFLNTLSFSVESEERIRKFVENPLSILNDDIKNLFKKYDDVIEDYRIPLPASMMQQKKEYPAEIYCLMVSIAECLKNDNVLKFTDNDNDVPLSNIELTDETVANNYFRINNDKRKVWRYLDSKATDMAKTVLARAKVYGINKINLSSSCYGFAGYYQSMNEYISTLGTRKTSLREKIAALQDSSNISLVENDSESLNAIIPVIKNIFKIISEIVGAKLIDTNRFKMYLSFNAFDWLFASTGETFHSCIDMASAYNYGVGLLGMCGCPDWGMLIYTDDTKKTCYDIEALHIITRSWTCYTENNEFQVVNWYPKDIRENVNIESSPVEDIKFRIDRRYGTKSKSSWNPITFCNGGVAWIYSDLNKFVVNSDNKSVHFEMNGACGITDLVLKSEDNLLHPGSANQDILSAMQRYGFKSVGDSVVRGLKISQALDEFYKCQHAAYYDENNSSDETYTCEDCGDTFDSDEDLTYIDSEDIYVCSSCLERHFFWCESCEEYHRLDEAVEVFNGSHPWNYTLICASCTDGSSEIFWDEIQECYYWDSISSDYVYYKNGDEKLASEYTINDLVSQNKIFKHSNEKYYDYPEEESQTEENS